MMSLPILILKCLFNFHLILYLLILLPPVAACWLRSSCGSSKEPARISIVIRDIATPSPPIPLTSQQAPPSGSSGVVSFKPTITVIVAVLASIFFITFLLLFYVKHCRRRNRSGHSSNIRGTDATSASRKHSGIEKDVIESLPTFRFSSLDGRKEGLECSVCLTRFESAEVMKLLPKCHHGFHVECVDTWLDTHSTCPLCRDRVKSEDILLTHSHVRTHENQLTPSPLALAPLSEQETNHARALVPAPLSEHETNHTRALIPALSTSDQLTEYTDIDTSADIESVGELQRVSGRHSSAGDKTSSGFISNTFTKRLSLDNSSSKNTSDRSIGCFERPKRKDGLLLTNKEEQDDQDDRKVRLEHQINIVFAEDGDKEGRMIDRSWSEIQALDRLYLRSDMIISGGGSVGRKSGDDRNDRVENAVNMRSMSDLTPFKRFSNSIRHSKK